MPTKFDPASHHRRSIRLKGYDYSQPGAYFVTMCTYERLPLFGGIVGEEMHVNFVGRIAQQEWERLPKRFPFLEIGSFVVMPNHIHGILIIGHCKVEGGGTANTEEATGMEILRRAPTFEQFGRPVPGSIPTIVRSFKASVTWRVNRLRQGFNHQVWQRNYYEHVILDGADLERIDAYIQSNPQLWDKDQINPYRVS